MNALTASDCLCPMLLRVTAEQRYRDVVATNDDSRVFAVMDDGRYLGLVTEKQAALFPQRIFADLVVLRQPDPVRAAMSIADVIIRIQASKDQYLPVIDGAGDLVGAISQASVFTTLARKEQELREQHEALIAQLAEELNHRRVASSVFDATSEGILVTDERARIMAVNRAFTETTGFTLDHVRGMSPSILKSGRHDGEFYQALWETLRENGSWSGEIWNRRKDGEVYPELLHINAIRDEQGAITNYVGIFSDLSHHKNMQHQLHRMAYYDPLTGLPNRQLFYDRLSQTITRMRRNGSGFSLMFIDLDHFKDINDTEGHPFGDRVLVEAAQRLLASVRESDVVARLGGDEFVVILSDDLAERVTALVAQKILDAIAAPFHIDGRQVFMNASIGIARYPEDGDAIDSLVRHADTAMYRAKESGRGCSCFFTPEMNERVAERLAMEVALRSGLGNGELYLVWQPVIRLRDGLMTGVEALARWRHGELGEVSPGRFIPVAEQSGMIGELGAWALDEAARLAAGLRQFCGRCPLHFAVNVSPLQLRDADAAKHIVNRLEGHGLPLDQVVIEITESALMSQEHTSEELFQELGGHGIRLAVDDFGTGYSNLAYLKRFPVHHLKIDQAFVKDLAESRAAQQIVEAIIRMAHALGIKTIAEGVETEAQREILHQLDCDEAQGFLFAAPLLPDELTARCCSDYRCANSPRLALQ